MHRIVGAAFLLFGTVVYSGPQAPPAQSAGITRSMFTNLDGETLPQLGTSSTIARRCRSDGADATSPVTTSLLHTAASGTWAM